MEDLEKKISKQLSDLLQRPLIRLDFSENPGEEPQILQNLISADLAIVSKFNLTQLRPLLNALAQKSLICIIEAEPGDLQLLFDAFIYIEKISKHPLIYFCSHTHWYADGRIQKFDTWTHPGKLLPDIQKFFHLQLGMRRYYFTDHLFLKRYQGEIYDKHRREFIAEINFLNRYPNLFPQLPKVLKYSREPDESWMLRELIPGINLMEAINQGVAYQPWQVISEVLAQLVKLEENGLFHTDLRTWNVLLTEAGPTLIIDYGAISHTTEDVRGKHVCFAFIKFCYETVNRMVMSHMTFNPGYLHPDNYPPEYHNLLKNIVCTAYEKWSFRLFSHFLYSQQPPSPSSANYLNKTFRWLNRQAYRYDYYMKFPGNGKQLFISGSPFRLHKVRIRHVEKHFFKKFEMRFIQRQIKDYEVLTLK